MRRVSGGLSADQEHPVHEANTSQGLHTRASMVITRSSEQSVLTLVPEDIPDAMLTFYEEAGIKVSSG